VENPENEVLMVTKENKVYSAAVDGLPRQYLYIYLYIFLFVVIKPENPFFVSLSFFLFFLWLLQNPKILTSPPVGSVVPLFFLLLL